MKKAVNYRVTNLMGVRQMKFKIAVAFACIMIFLVACGGEGNSEDAKSLDTKEMKELVQDYTTRNLQAESASITSTELIVKDNDNQERVYDLPEDEFFVSIAPFINDTHPCDIHSLTGCQGELVEQDFDLQVTDSAGNVIIDEIKRTEANGFIDLWLPRNETYNVIITQDGKTTESEISTFEEDNTCITTMQLI